jgi:hypothetical protein
VLSRLFSVVRQFICVPGSFGERSTFLARDGAETPAGFAMSPGFGECPAC